MPPRFVFHIGPIKTGSTSIQSFLEQEAKNNSLIEYKRIKPDHFFSLRAKGKSQSATEHFKRLFERKISTDQNNQNKTCIFSHECMYQRPENIARLIEIATEFSEDISVICYLRQQSKHYRSHFSQFLYFDQPLVSKIEEVFTNNGLNLELFTGLESFFIALCLSNFKIVQPSGPGQTEYQNWQRIIKISDKCQPFGVHFIAGLIPQQPQHGSLIQDFCNKAKIKRNNSEAPTNDIHIHTALPDPAVEILHQAIKNNLNLPSKKPEHLPCFKAFRSKKFHNNKFHLHDQNLLKHLSDFIDTHYLPSNKTVCQRFNLSPNYFTPSTRRSGEEIEAIIQDTHQQRLNHPLQRLQLTRELLTESLRYLMLNDLNNRN